MIADTFKKNYSPFYVGCGESKEKTAKSSGGGKKRECREKSDEDTARTPSNESEIASWMIELLE